MKKCVALLLCVCALCALPVTALAADVTDYTVDDWKLIYSVPEPRYEDYEDSDEYAAAWDAWYVGFSSFIVTATQAEYTRQAQEEADRIAAEEAAQRAAEEQKASESTSTKPTESAGSNNGNSNPGVANDSDDKYPVGSYVDSSGSVWSPDGTRLSPIFAPGTTPAAYPTEDDALLSDVLGSPGAASPQSIDPEVAEITMELLYDLLSDVASDTEELASDKSVAYVIDLRPADTPVVVLDGLKALVNSVFGEYTPVTTNTVVTQTIGNDTYEYLVETVAPGAAGVDYEWVAGVFLFGIMLFCLMKLLGGILK